MLMRLPYRSGSPCIWHVFHIPPKRSCRGRRPGRSGRFPSLNIFRMLAHADSAFVPFMRLSERSVERGRTAARGARAGHPRLARETEAEYEWGQHQAVATLRGRDRRADRRHRGRGPRRRGLRPAPTGRCSPWRAASCASRAAPTRSSPPPASTSANREILAIHLVVGVYFMLARVMTNLELELDDPVAEALVDGAARADRARAARGDEGG